MRPCKFVACTCGESRHGESHMVSLNADFQALKEKGYKPFFTG